MNSEEALKEIVEIYAGMDGIEPETAPEAYLLMVIEQMYEVARGALTGGSQRTGTAS